MDYKKNVVALKKRMSQTEVYRLDDDEYRDYMRSELHRARNDAAAPKKGVLDVLLTILFFIGIVMIVMHQNGMLGKP